MARKIPKPEPAPATAPDQGAAAKGAVTQRDILHPERSRQIGGRLVEMREYGYIEGMRVQAAGAVFLDDLFALFPRAGLPPTDVAINAVVARHITVVHWMMAQAMTPSDDDLQAFGDAVRENTNWVGRLDYESGEALKNLWWAANASFFFRLLKNKAEAAKAAESLSASVASTTP